MDLQVEGGCALSSKLESKSPGLRRSLGVFDGISILVGITIGAGIYSTPQIIATYEGSIAWTLVLWVVVGLFALVGALVYAELGTRIPETGGEYVYISRCFGPYVGFVFGWSQLIIIRTSPAAGLAIVTANYLAYFVELPGFAHTLVALAVIWLFGALNYVGVHRAAVYQRYSTIIKLGGAFLLPAIGLLLLSMSDVTPAVSTAPAPERTTSTFVAVMMLIVFSYMGWDRVGYVAGEMRDPRRVIPISMVGGITAVVGAYLAMNWFYFQTLGWEGVRGSTIVASDAAVQMMGPIGASLVATLVIVSATGSINGTMMTATRSYFAMARDGLFFKWLDYVHPTFRTPSRAILVHCFWGSVILLVRQNFETIVAGMAFAVLIFYGLTAVALFRLRRESPETGAFKMPFYPWLPGLYLAGIVLLIALRIIFEFEKSIIDLAYIASGIPFAFVWCRKKAAAGSVQE